MVGVGKVFFPLNGLVFLDFKSGAPFVLFLL